MSYIIHLYKVTADKDDVSKTLQSDKQITASMLAEDDLIDFENVRFHLGSMAIDDFVTAGYNYMYVPKLKRYYFIDKVEVTTYHELIVTASEDYLYTWRSGIRSLTCFVLRNEKTYNKEIVDDSFPITSKRNISVKNIGTLGNDYTYILTTAGGVY